VGGVAATVRRLAARTPASRERSVDLMRGLAICLVVLGHWFVVAVTYRDGELSGDNALHVLDWLHPFTWLFQVMPIFFLVGGYASGASFASHRAAGGDGVGWVLRRTDRLLRPTTALFVVLPATTIVAVALGADTELLGTAAWLASIPLWFLLAYLAMVVLTPALLALHRRAGLAAPVAMVVLVGVADLFRLVLDVPYVGESSYLFGWLAVYQLGFCWRDGRLPVGRGAAAALTVGGLATLIALTAGPYGTSMVVHNANPPTLALMALAATQVGIVLAVRPAADRWLRRSGPWTAVVAANAVILTVFLWHMTAAAIAAAVMFPTGLMAQPRVGCGSWLLWRVPWLLSCAVVLAVLVAVFARIELRRPVRRAPERSARRDGLTVLGMAAALAGLLGVALSGSDYHGVTGLPWGAVTSYLCGAALLRVARTEGWPSPQAAPPSAPYISSTRSP
jgi:fucose 4-O-acetylase-like acetyltransferase